MAELFKYCPNCGSENHEFINSHRFECKDCDFVYYHNMAAAVMVIIERNGKYLFTVRNNEPAKGKLDFPGGFVDPGETAAEAVVRELKEELDLDLNIGDLQLIDTEANDYLFKNIPYRTLDVIFKIVLDHDVVLKKEDSEIQDVMWLSKDEIDLDKIGFRSMRKVVEKHVLK
ncbi:NUDIX hydrolase [Ornithobacterium rhinotracheale]|uniref:NUDIX hydrolase n=1 Tax=Ornithobacterium rhinotracheale TaxID=28251 RepID=UPI001FF47F65|nr:NUDIX domain-containing protein [Ornithobacterium rhinotracheale]MCK0204602.1 NUDIX domain-containing protein [Ornithobacterium rhinotracheale]